MIQFQTPKSWEDWCTLIREQFPKVITKIDLIRPQATKGQELRSYYRKMWFEYNARAKRVRQCERRRKRYNLCDRLQERVDEYKAPVFVTITLKDVSLSLTREQLFRKWKAFLKCFYRNDWAMVSDYGQENGRLHYHGFFDADIEYLLANTKYKGHSVKHGQDVQMRYIENIYFNVTFELPTQATHLNKSEAIKTMCRYCTKYSLKDNMQDKEFKHKLYYSRKISDK